MSQFHENLLSIASAATRLSDDLSELSPQLAAAVLEETDNLTDLLQSAVEIADAQKRMESDLADIDTCVVRHALDLAAEAEMGGDEEESE